jgi:uncharacterized protein with FMN-binding domain
MVVRRSAPTAVAGTRRIVLFVATTIVALVLLFSYRTSRGPGASNTAAPLASGDYGVGIVNQPAGPAPTPGASGSAGAGASPTASATGGAGSGSSGKTVVNGTVAQTFWGPVQVQVTINSGKITDVNAIQYPRNNGRDMEINAYALPQLRSEVLAAQSAQIDAISGATITSGGYIESLQAALDIAHFG